MCTCADLLFLIVFLKEKYLSKVDVSLTFVDPIKQTKSDYLTFSTHTDDGIRSKHESVCT